MRSEELKVKNQGSRMDTDKFLEQYLLGKAPLHANRLKLPTEEELDEAEAAFDSLTPDLRREWGFAPPCGTRATFSGSSKDPSRPLRGERELKHRSLWPYAVAASVAGFVAIFLVSSRKTNVEPEEQPVVAEVVEKPVQKVSEASDYSENSDYSDITKGTKPRKVSKPLEEPQLAEAELLLEETEMETEQEYSSEVAEKILSAALYAQEIRSRGERFREELDQKMAKL